MNCLFFPHFYFHFIIMHSGLIAMHSAVGFFVRYSACALKQGSLGFGTNLQARTHTQTAFSGIFSVFFCASPSELSQSVCFTPQSQPKTFVRIVADRNPSACGFAVESKPHYPPTPRRCYYKLFLYCIQPLNLLNVIYFTTLTFIVNQLLPLQ